MPLALAAAPVEVVLDAALPAEVAAVEPQAARARATARSPARRARYGRPGRPGRPGRLRRLGRLR
ncbi:MAG: hypothetical protein ACYDH5_07700 [Acidimicrobiales bacterium]